MFLDLVTWIAGINFNRAVLILDGTLLWTEADIHCMIRPVVLNDEEEELEYIRALHVSYQDLPPCLIHVCLSGTGHAKDEAPGESQRHTKRDT